MTITVSFGCVFFAGSYSAKGFMQWLGLFGNGIFWDGMGYYGMGWNRIGWDGMGLGLAVGNWDSIFSGTGGAAGRGVREGNNKRRTSKTSKSG
jgi:hypothetical protein